MSAIRADFVVSAACEAPSNPGVALTILARIGERERRLDSPACRRKQERIGCLRRPGCGVDTCKLIGPCCATRLGNGYSIRSEVRRKASRCTAHFRRKG